MKMGIIILLIVSCQNVYGQVQESLHSTEMAKLNQLIGNWQGHGWIQERGKRSEFKQTEVVQSKLNGTTLLIQGNGFESDSLVFQAMAVISYNIESKKYRFNSFLADGKYVEAEGSFNDDGSFYWQFDVPSGGMVKYDINFSATTWQEKGYYSPKDVDQWYPFLEMNLIKKN